MKSKALHMVTFILLVVGGLNWLLVGVFSWDIGAIFGGQDAVLSRIVYILVGLSAVYEIAIHKGSCCLCGKCDCVPKKGSTMPMSDSKPMPDSNDSATM